MKVGKLNPISSSKSYSRVVFRIGDILLSQSTTQYTNHCSSGQPCTPEVSHSSLALNIITSTHYSQVTVPRKTKCDINQKWTVSFVLLGKLDLIGSIRPELTDRNHSKLSGTVDFHWGQRRGKFDPVTSMRSGNARRICERARVQILDEINDMHHWRAPMRAKFQSTICFFRRKTLPYLFLQS